MTAAWRSTALGVWTDRTGLGNDLMEEYQSEGHLHNRQSVSKLSRGSGGGLEQWCYFLLRGCLRCLLGFEQVSLLVVARTLRKSADIVGAIGLVVYCCQRTAAREGYVVQKIIDSDRGWKSWAKQFHHTDEQLESQGSHPTRIRDVPSNCSAPAVCGISRSTEFCSAFQAFLPTARQAQLAVMQICSRPATFFSEAPTIASLRCHVRVTLSYL
eukprot:CAMPEP_0169261158 /NCGR_PEP_ID=MMETSP1016-20121227/42926_1 /TAXON_ID=342587 /ORGANISM="Karlodinium micrum, Strain CCMP2283" /LENGTH=212 /DNA_ID=CAMNT_0009343401 /DNA_START=46 /DNA_END=685 /DNA_ORIENTATION=-